MTCSAGQLWENDPSINFVHKLRGLDRTELCHVFRVLYPGEDENVSDSGEAPIPNRPFLMCKMRSGRDPEKCEVLDDLRKGSDEAELIRRAFEHVRDGSKGSPPGLWISTTMSLAVAQAFSGVFFQKTAVISLEGMEEGHRVDLTSKVHLNALKHFLKNESGKGDLERIDSDFETIKKFTNRSKEVLIFDQIHPRLVRVLTPALKGQCRVWPFDFKDEFGAELSDLLARQYRLEKAADAHMFPRAEAVSPETLRIIGKLGGPNDGLALVRFEGMEGKYILKRAKPNVEDDRMLTSQEMRVQLRAAWVANAIKQVTSCDGESGAGKSLLACRLYEYEAYFMDFKGPDELFQDPTDAHQVWSGSFMLFRLCEDENEICTSKPNIYVDALLGVPPRFSLRIEIHISNLNPTLCAAELCDRVVLLLKVTLLEQAGMQVISWSKGEGEKSSGGIDAYIDLDGYIAVYDKEKISARVEVVKSVLGQFDKDGVIFKDIVFSASGTSTRDTKLHKLLMHFMDLDRALGGLGIDKSKRKDFSHFRLAESALLLLQAAFLLHEDTRPTDLSMTNLEAIFKKQSTLLQLMSLLDVSILGLLTNAEPYYQKSAQERFKFFRNLKVSLEGEQSTSSITDAIEKASRVFINRVSILFAEPLQIKQIQDTPPELEVIETLNKELASVGLVSSCSEALKRQFTCLPKFRVKHENVEVSVATVNSVLQAAQDHEIVILNSIFHLSCSPKITSVRFCLEVEFCSENEEQTWYNADWFAIRLNRSPGNLEWGRDPSESSPNERSGNCDAREDRIEDLAERLSDSNLKVLFLLNCKQHSTRNHSVWQTVQNEKIYHKNLSFFIVLLEGHEKALRSFVLDFYNCLGQGEKYPVSFEICKKKHSNISCFLINPSVSHFDTLLNPIIQEQEPSEESNDESGLREESIRCGMRFNDILKRIFWVIHSGANLQDTRTGCFDSSGLYLFDEWALQMETTQRYPERGGFVDVLNIAGSGGCGRSFLLSELAKYCCCAYRPWLGVVAKRFGTAGSSHGKDDGVFLFGEGLSEYDAIEIVRNIDTTFENSRHSPRWLLINALKMSEKDLQILLCPSGCIDFVAGSGLHLVIFSRKERKSSLSLLHQNQADAFIDRSRSFSPTGQHFLGFCMHYKL